MIDLGMLSDSWLPRLHPQHAQRLQSLLDDPNG